MVGADKIIGVDLTPAREAIARKFGMTHFVNPNDVENLVDHIVQLTDGGADYSFECIGNTKVMRQALECTHKGWGQSIIIGVRADRSAVTLSLGRKSLHAVSRRGSISLAGA
jgi:S-(hydroxymethyl)glutathione dehydrogenase/alcohol dehydrogenase